MIIDAHQHFWKADRGDYHWMTPAVPVLARDYLPDELRPELRKTGVNKTILVQAAQTVAETQFLCRLARETDFVAGVIGWFDLEREDFPNTFDRHLRENPSLLGVRPMLQDLEDNRWILRPQVIRNLEYLGVRKAPFEFLTYTRHLPFVLQVLRQVPALHAVVDHLSKPEIKAGVFQPWADLMLEVSKHPNVFCKLSGMVTEADHGHWCPAHLSPYINHVLRCFGEDRVIFGSDWPVCLLAATYAEVVNALRTAVAPQLTPAGLDKLFFRNAANFYRIQ
jgi:L-fuconolactonase